MQLVVHSFASLTAHYSRKKRLPGCAAPFYVSLRSGFVAKQQQTKPEVPRQKREAVGSVENQDAARDGPYALDTDQP